MTLIDQFLKYGKIKHTQRQLRIERDAIVARYITFQWYSDDSTIEKNVERCIIACASARSEKFKLAEKCARMFENTAKFFAAREGKYLGCSAQEWRSIYHRKAFDLHSVLVRAARKMGGEA